jgi:hypothetical protein
MGQSPPAPAQRRRASGAGGLCPGHTLNDRKQQSPPRPGDLARTRRVRPDTKPGARDRPLKLPRQLGVICNRGGRIRRTPDLVPPPRASRPTEQAGLSVKRVRQARAPAGRDTPLALGSRLVVGPGSPSETAPPDLTKPRLPPPRSSTSRLGFAGDASARYSDRVEIVARALVARAADSAHAPIRPRASFLNTWPRRSTHLHFATHERGGLPGSSWSERTSPRRRP